MRCSRAGDTAAHFGTLLTLESRENLFPLIFAGRTVKSRKDKHEHFRSHTEGKQQVASGKMQNLEKSAPDNDGGADRICEIEETLAFLAADESAESLLICLDRSHLSVVLFFVLFLPFGKSDLRADTAETYI